MKSIDMSEAVGLLDDRLLEEYEQYRAGRRWLKPAVVAASLCLVAGTAAAGLSRLNGLGTTGGNESMTGGIGHGESSSYMHYEGPTLPLTLREENDALSAERTLTFDFSSAADERNACALLDSYTLTNTADEPVTVEALYPFVGSIRDLDTLSPTITLDGAELSPTLYTGSYAGGYQRDWDGELGETLTLNLDTPSGFLDYEALLSDGQYLTRALSDPPDLDLPVSLYTMTDFGAPEGYPAATFALSFVRDAAESSILTLGFNGYSLTDDGLLTYSFFIPEEPKPRYLAVLGGDLPDYQTAGYIDGGCEEGEELDGVTAAITRSETTLAAFLTRGLQEYEDWYAGEPLSEQKRSMLLRAVGELLTDAGLLSDQTVTRYQDGRLEDVISDTYGQQRVFYAAFSLTIPAGESVQLDCSLSRFGSYDFACESTDAGALGFEMATTLGSNLTFSEQKATIAGTEDIFLMRENFGFDLENGITTVTLGDAARYTMEVRFKDK